MDYVEGCYPTQIKFISISMKKHMLKNICKAIIKLHEEGIVHRDIKPENILVDVDKDMKV